jgi:hypothetical protein
MNSKLIDYSINMKGSFTYRGRGIRYGSMEYGNYTLYVYEDARLRGEEIVNGKFKIAKNGRIKLPCIFIYQTFNMNLSMITKISYFSTFIIYNSYF